MTEFRRPPTAQEAVLAELRARILAGSLPPGTPLRQDVLAADLGVSRVPLREALRMLEAEGHVRYAPHRGYRVVELDIMDLEELYHLRALVEDDLTRRAILTQGAKELSSVRAAFAELEAVESSPDPDPLALALANRTFHWTVMRPTPRAERILTTLWDASQAYRARWFAEPGNVARGAHEHTAVMAAVELGDADTVVHLLAEHRAGAVSALRTALVD